MGGTLQTVDYTYNIRGWLTNINDVNSIGSDLFAMQLQYDDAPTANRLFNGNIGQIQWKTANTDNSLKTYSYTYDALNRIKQGLDNTGNYNLQSIAYDKNGNITALNRMGHINDSASLFGNMDSLAYAYDAGNKLRKVTDSGNKTFGFKDGSNTGNDYFYDVNGNLTKDLNKNITDIAYNYLNLPEKVTISGQSIEYVYDAAGNKLQKIVSGVTTDYLNGYQYQNGSLQFFPHAEGYVSNESGTYKYVYNHTDHLGNVRVSYAKNGSSLQILEENNYYPFGLKHKGYNNTLHGSASAYNYEYNGKEMQSDHGLDWYDYGARMYDATVGRWFVQDAFAEKYLELSPYQYAANNPILIIDINGDSTFVNNQGDITNKQVDDDGNLVDNLVFITNEDGSVTSIGELGENIDISEILQKLLDDHGQEAESMGILEWKSMVQQFSDWDLKNNENTIFGLTWAFDEGKSNKTKFKFGDVEFGNAADVGNFHAGFTGTKAGIPISAQFLGAGVFENKKNKSFLSSLLPILPTIHPRAGFVPSGTQRYLIPPHQDKSRDYYWNRRGMKLAKKKKVPTATLR